MKKRMLTLDREVLTTPDHASTIEGGTNLSVLTVTISLYSIIKEVLDLTDVDTGGGGGGGGGGGDSGGCVTGSCVCQTNQAGGPYC